MTITNTPGAVRRLAARRPAVRRVGAVVAACGLLATAGTAGATISDDGELSEGRQSEWFDEAEFELQLAARSIAPEGPEGEPWLQAIEPTMIDTSDLATEGPWTLCFSNTDVGNPWRVVGWTTMQEEVALHDEIADFVVRDAGGSQEQQIADIEELVDSGNCDILIVSPGSTAALTPAVELACESLPVIVFDRGVNTDCPVTFIKPIGGYAFGADAADFMVDNVDPGGRILALRILPGVDVLETRWVAGQIIMEEAGLEIIDNVFTDGDNARVKSIIQDYLDRGEQIDGVWMDAGATSVAAIEAFEENGLEVPPINGEDQQDFLQKWSDEGLTAVAPTYPTYQWRTPILAALSVLGGEEIPGGDWLLPQPVITDENLADYLQPDMPPLHYALCGCENMANFPDAWQ
jgi:ribose transport system substrate-binding protein